MQNDAIKKREMKLSENENGDRKNVKEMMTASKKTIVKTANAIVQENVKTSKFFDSTVEDRVPRFAKEELVLGRVLGRGGFCMAIEIEKVEIDGSPVRTGSSIGSNAFKSLFRRSSRDVSSKGSADEDITEERSLVEVPRARYSMGTRRDIARMAGGRRRRGGKFVLKQIQPDLDNFAFLKGLVDLSMEAKFLASLDHPNIISLCGMSTKGPAHFIMIERLQETLSTRFKTWTKIDRQCKGITGVLTGSKHKEITLYEDRISVAYNMANALSYLHDAGIIYRDLKPDNCGFDLADKFKLFDFGLAKELKETDKTERGLYNLTGMTGAIRYMAPEVGLSKPYNLSADVYSWSMCCWFILALEPPFGFYTEDMIRDRVFKRGSRPAIFDSWSQDLGETLRQAWGADIAGRPTFKHIRDVLMMELQRVSTTADSSRSTSRGSSNVTAVDE